MHLGAADRSRLSTQLGDGARTLPGIHATAQGSTNASKPTGGAMLEVRARVMTAALAGSAKRATANAFYE